jgi:2-polyprenyl-6-methoxyphenol hydroxylase-like FAD-dependent oxidoreductase
MPTNQRIPVFIAGGGPVGLSMALALARFGVRSVVVERNATTTEHPKSRGCFVRTMEIFRQWGVESGIRARGLPDGSDVFAYLGPGTGLELGRTRSEPDIGHSPTWKSMVAQDAVEEELLSALRLRPEATVLFSTELTGFEDLGDRVRVQTRDLTTGTEGSWEADWLIAADGAGSSTRRTAGIEMEGPACLAVMLNEYVRADLSDLPTARDAGIISCAPLGRGEPVITLLNTNGRDRWLVVMRVGAESDERERDFTPGELQDLLRRNLNRPELNVTRINTSIWRMSRQVAARFRNGRVVLAGDAAHRFPPTGGYGLNSGVQDAHNLAWKLAYVLDGTASEALIDTYDEERRPVATSNADFSLGNYHRMAHVGRAVQSGEPDRIAFWLDDQDNHIHSVGQSLGFTYERGAVIGDGSTPLPQSSRFYAPSDRPGSRYPHAWLDDEHSTSTLDWFDRDFALVVGEGGDAWLEAGRLVAKDLGITLGLHRAPAAVTDLGCKAGQRGAVLVRPDGHVAWRMAWLPDNPQADLRSAIETLLGRS